MVNFVALTKVVVWATPLYVTVEVLRKPVPLIVRVCAAAPAVAEVGEIVVIAGTGFPTAKLTAADVPPPGAGFFTTTGKVPAVAWSPVVRAIVNFVALTKVAVWATPLYVTVEVLRKPVPLIVRVWAAAPTAAEVGERLVIAGARLFTAKLTAADVPPPGAGFFTTTGKVPAVAWSPVVRAIVNFAA